MGKALRITFKDKDYTFQILNTTPITKSTAEFPIFIAEKPVVITKEPKGWRLKEEADFLDAELVQAIGRSIALRYRF